MTDQKHEGVRVRFAPSPTGYLHLGGARTALYNWLFARGNQGSFVLRIEDTDVQRSEGRFVESILSDMLWLGLDWDEGPQKGGQFGPYFQSERQAYYKKYYQRLLEMGMAYHCFCKSEELDERKREMESASDFFRYDGRCRDLSDVEVERRLSEGEAAAVRFMTPVRGFVSFNDLIRKKISVENRQIEDFIIVRSDGIPTYNFTVVIDDIEMQITHVIRGDDHISNTPKHVMIYNALGIQPPMYAHIPMILGEDGTRLSKRHGATSINAYKEMGYLPEAMINYLALLGWAFDDKQTIFARQELIEKFSLKGVSKKAAIFDRQKLIWMNGTYIRKLDTKGLLNHCMPLLKRAFGDDLPEDLDLEKIISIAQPRMKLITDIVHLNDYFFQTEIKYDNALYEEFMHDEKILGLLRALQEALTMIKSFTKDDLEEAFQRLISVYEIKFKEIANPLRVAVTGKASSPGLFDVLMILGKKRVLERLKRFIELIENKKNDCRIG